MARRDRHQRQIFVQRRLSKAVDRLIAARTPAGKAQAAKWARLWQKVAGKLRF